MYKYLHVFRVLAEDGRGLRRDSVRLTGGRAQLAPTHLQWLLRLLTKTVGAVFDRQPCLLRYSVGWTGGRAQLAPTHLQWLLRLLTKTVGAVFDRQPCLLRYSVGWTGGRAQVVLHTTYNGY
jgi:hypothetical protein